MGTARFGHKTGAGIQAAGTAKCGHKMETESKTDGENINEKKELAAYQAE